MLCGCPAAPRSGSVALPPISRRAGGSIHRSCVTRCEAATEILPLSPSATGRRPQLAGWPDSMFRIIPSRVRAVFATEVLDPTTEHSGEGGTVGVCAFVTQDLGELSNGELPQLPA